MTQTIDFRFELLFLVCVFVSLISLITVLVQHLRGRRHTSKKILVGIGIGWLAYLSIVVVVSATTLQQIIPKGHGLCRDDLCFDIANFQTLPRIQALEAKNTFYIVSVRVSNHARGRAQSEQGLYARLYSRGHEYQVSPAGQSAWEAAHPKTAGLTTRVRAGQSFLSDQVFDVPTQTTTPGLVLSNGFTPGYFVIGECPLFHEPTILSL